MAVRRPLILTGSNDLIEMTDSQIDAVKDRCRYLYGDNPSVTLTRVNSGGDLGALNDTRLRAGAGITRNDRFATLAELEDVQTITDQYAHVDEVVDTTSACADTNNIAFPIYYNGSDIQTMSQQDMYDTFIFPAIDTILSAAGQPGTYSIQTSTSVGGYTPVSTDYIYRDRVADKNAYDAAGLIEVEDQEIVNTAYYLLKADNISPPSMEEMLFVRNSDNNLQEYSQAGIDAILQNCMRHVAASETGSKIRYRWNSTGTILGSAINDTKYNDSTRRTNQTGDNYKAQEHPSGSLVTQATHYLRMYEA